VLSQRTIPTVRKMLSADAIKIPNYLMLGYRDYDTLMPHAGKEEKVKIIDRLYGDMAQKYGRYDEDSETGQACKELEEFIDQKLCFETTGEFESTRSKLMDLATAYSAAHEKRGFTFGFRCAALLMHEVMRIE